MSKRFVIMYWLLVAGAALNVAIGITFQSPLNLVVALLALGMAALVHHVGSNAA
jgi:hypothetical protein